MGGATPEQVVLGDIRKKLEQASGVKPVSSTPSWALHQLLRLLPGVAALTLFSDGL